MTWEKDNGKQTKKYGEYAKQQADLIASKQANIDKAIVDSNAAKTLANESKNKSEEAINRANQIIANTGNSNTEIVDGRIRTDGTIAPTIGGHIRELGKQLSDTSRQTSVLSQGTSVINASVDTLADVEIEGRTLTSLGNTPLEPTKKYVVADKKTKVVVDGATVSGVGKFIKNGVSERVKVIRVENFEGKVSGSTVENPHVAKNATSSVISPPTTAWIEIGTTGNASYDSLKSLNGVTSYTATSASGNLAQQLFSFNLIEAVERNVGRIPRTTVVDKVAWLKVNISRLTANWHGFGSSVGGNKATFNIWRSDTNVWYAIPETHPNGNITRLLFGTAFPATFIDANGFIHYTAYADASNGTQISVIYSDYIDLEIELKADADFTQPKVALYEVTDDAYNKILVDWNANDVVNRYPIVEGTQHLQGVGVIAEGENLLPPFTEWATSSNSKVIARYELELNSTALDQFSAITIPVVPNTTYYMTGITSDRYEIYGFKADKSTLISVIKSGFGYVTSVSGISITIPTDAYFLNIRATNRVVASGVTTFKNPMLTLGSTAKPFVPRNPSSVIADVKLGAIGDKKDILFKDNGRWMLRKSLEKDFLLDENVGWFAGSDGVGTKRFSTGANALHNPMVNASATHFILTDHRGMRVDTSNAYLGERGSFLSGTGQMTVWINDSETGFLDNQTPTFGMIKAYFSGWKYTGNGTTHTWVSLVDGTPSPTQTEAYVSSNKAPNYTPYKLSYVLATPQVTDVTDKVEGALKLGGLTQVEVVSGYVRREKINPVLASGFYFINDASLPNSHLKNKVRKIAKVYKNTVQDFSWTIQYFDAFGDKAFIKVVDFDPTAEYTVMYIVLDKHLITANPINVKLTYANSVRNALDDAVKEVQDNSTQLSVHEKAIVDLYVRVKALEVR